MIAAKAQVERKSVVSLPSDHIVLNVGGHLFETTCRTLSLSGSRFFEALLGSTGTALATGIISYDDNDDDDDDAASQSFQTLADPSLSSCPSAPLTASPCAVKRNCLEADASAADHSMQPCELRRTNKSATSTCSTNGGSSMIFIDRDWELFDDILYFMRNSQQRLRGRTRSNPQKLKDLQDEAEFFCYDALYWKCEEYLEIVQREIPTASAHLLRVPCYEGYHDLEDTDQASNIASINATTADRHVHGNIDNNDDNNDDNNEISNNSDNDNSAMHGTRGSQVRRSRCKIGVPRGQCLYIASARACFAPPGDEISRLTMSTPPPQQDEGHPPQVLRDNPSLQLPPDDGQTHSFPNFRNRSNGNDDQNNYDKVNLHIRLNGMNTSLDNSSGSIATHNRSNNHLDTANGIHGNSNRSNSSNDNNVFLLHSVLRRRASTVNCHSMDPILRLHGSITGEQPTPQRSETNALSFGCTTIMDHFPICVSSQLPSKCLSTQQSIDYVRQYNGSDSGSFCMETQDIEFFATSTCSEGYASSRHQELNNNGLSGVCSAWFEVHYWVGHPSAIPGLLLR